MAPMLTSSVMVDIEERGYVEVYAISQSSKW